YRMFTSRAEHRLVLREDNAEARLAGIGRRVGLLPDRRWEEARRRINEVSRAVEILKEAVAYPTDETNRAMAELGSAALRKPATLAELVARPELSITKVAGKFAPKILPRLSPEAATSAEIELKYSGYIESERRRIAQMGEIERAKLPESVDYEKVHGLSSEIREKLGNIRPRTLAQAARIPGVTPAAISILMVWLKSRAS
nr:tRNA uridine-5-carboxymethylaminomethyl(34) synthesis enzyme MnmG [bacterium]